MEPQELSLTPQERSILNAVTVDTRILAPRRARIVLAWADGQTPETIARLIQTRPAYIRRVTTAFQEKHLDMFSAASLKRAQIILTPKPADTSTVPALSMRQTAHLILSHQFTKLKNTEAAVRAADDVEAVHDMRVACRRMNSALRLFKPYLPAKRVKKLRGVMEQLRDLLGEARNLDVLLHDLSQYGEKHSEADRAQLEKIADEWRAQRQKLQANLIALLDSDAYKTWCERMDAFLATADDDTTPRVADVVPALIWQQYGTVRAYETRFYNAPLDDLHALRIDIKRLRYTLEFFADAFAHKPKALIEPLVTLQDQLGLIQDAVVAEQALTTFLVAQADAAAGRNEPLDDFQAIAAYHAHLQARIASVRARLPERWKLVIKPTFRKNLANAVATL